MATGGIGICPLGFEQFDQGASEKLTWPCPRWFEGSYETNENTQNEIQTYPKWS
jgi:hypothetical protein